jgi:hypothetical protein
MASGLVMDADDQNWKKHFQIQSQVDLDFVIGQKRGCPVGMERSSPAAFKRRVLAAKLSYEMQLSSIDYTLKRYVDQELYEKDDVSLGETISHYLRTASNVLMSELKKLHTQGEMPFGILGAELTLFRVPHALDTARMLSNRGLLLEVLPLLRMCLEMIAWAHTAYYVSDNDAVVELRAQSCISSLKETYKSAGKIYGLLSQFTHWGHAIHRHFIGVDEANTWVVEASVRYRAISLALCLVILDIYVEVIRKVYGERSDTLVSKVQGVSCPDPARNSCQYVSRMANTCELVEIREIRSLLQ